MNTQDTTTNTAPQQMPPDAILSQMLWGGLMQQSICVAAKLGIADLLAEKPQAVGELDSLCIVFFDCWRVPEFLRKIPTENLNSRRLPNCCGMMRRIRCGLLRLCWAKIGCGRLGVN